MEMIGEVFGGGVKERVAIKVLVKNFQKNNMLECLLSHLERSTRVAIKRNLINVRKLVVVEDGVEVM